MPNFTLSLGTLIKIVFFVSFITLILYFMISRYTNDTDSVNMKKNQQSETFAFETRYKRGMMKNAGKEPESKSSPPLINQKESVFDNFNVFRSFAPQWMNNIVDITANYFGEDTVSAKGDTVRTFVISPTSFGFSVNGRSWKPGDYNSEPAELRTKKWKRYNKISTEYEKIGNEVFREIVVDKGGDERHIFTHVIVNGIEIHTLYDDGSNLIAIEWLDLHQTTYPNTIHKSREEFENEQNENRNRVQNAANVGVYLILVPSNIAVGTCENKKEMLKKYLIRAIIQYYEKTSSS